MFMIAIVITNVIKAILNFLWLHAGACFKLKFLRLKLSVGGFDVLKNW